jgi:hypothetical protein
MSAAIGLELKALGQAATAEANRDWGRMIRPVFLHWLRMRQANGQLTFAMEDFRMHCNAAGRALMPSSHHAWGSFARAMQCEGFIQWTGAYRTAESPETHGHPVRLYRIKQLAH